MKGRILTCIFAAMLGVPLSAGVDYREYARLLDTYVAPAGVRYEAWAGNAADLAALEAVMEGFAEVEVGALTVPERKAFYINLYNAGMLQVVFEHYPIASVKEIGPNPFDVFKEDFIRQGGRDLSLDEVEKGILLGDYFDPRIHFAVNCASESCPPLRPEPFSGSTLEAQLEEQTRAFANSERAARVDHEAERVAYSALFQWYADDFRGANPATYLNDYREDPLPLDYDIGWIEYDWSLNAAE